MRKKIIYDQMTVEQKRRAAQMAIFFPAISPGHGSQHRDEIVEDHGVPTQCNAKDCHPVDGKHHHQDKYTAAADFILERDR